MAKGLLTQADALRKVERELGFPSPKKEYLQLYFLQDGIGASARYSEAVDFPALAEAIVKGDFVNRINSVRNYSRSDARRRNVEEAFLDLVQQYRTVVDPMPRAL